MKIQQIKTFPFRKEIYYFENDPRYLFKLALRKKEDVFNCKSKHYYVPFQLLDKKYDPKGIGIFVWFVKPDMQVDLNKFEFFSKVFENPNLKMKDRFFLRNAILKATYARMEKIKIQNTKQKVYDWLGILPPESTPENKNTSEVREFNVEYSKTLSIPDYDKIKIVNEKDTIQLVTDLPVKFQINKEYTFEHQDIEMLRLFVNKIIDELTE